MSLQLVQTWNPQPVMWDLARSMERATLVGAGAVCVEVELQHKGVKHTENTVDLSRRARQEMRCSTILLHMAASLLSQTTEGMWKTKPKKVTFGK